MSVPNIGVIQLMEHENLGLLVKRKSGKEQLHFGFRRDGNIFLFPEEVLVSLESKDYQVLSPVTGQPMSLEEAHSLLIKDASEFVIYNIFKDLRLKGFDVRRRRVPDMTAQIEEASKENWEVPRETMTKKIKLQHMNPITLFPCELTDLTQEVLPLIQDHEKRHRARDWEEYRGSRYKELRRCPNSCNSTVIRFSEMPSSQFTIRDKIRLPTVSLSSDTNVCPILSMTTVETFEDAMNMLEDACGQVQLETVDQVVNEHITFDITGRDMKGVIVVRKVDDDLPTVVQLKSLSRGCSKDTKVILAIYEKEWSSLKYFQWTSMNIWRLLPNTWKERVQIDKP